MESILKFFNIVGLVFNTLLTVFSFRKYYTLKKNKNLNNQIKGNIVTIILLLLIAITGNMIIILERSEYTNILTLSWVLFFNICIIFISKKISENFEYYRKYPQDIFLENLIELNELSKTIGSWGSWYWNPNTNEVVWDEGIYDIYEVDYLPDFDTITSFVHPDDLAEYNNEIDNPKESTQSTYRIITKSGTKRLLSLGRTKTKGNKTYKYGLLIDLSLQEKQKQKEQMIVNQSRILIGKNNSSDLRSFDEFIEYLEKTNYDSITIAGGDSNKGG